MKGTPRTCGCHSHNGYLLSPEGLAQREHEGPELAGVVATRYLDKVGSVSALVEVEVSHVFDDQLLDEQHRRFLSA